MKRAKHIIFVPVRIDQERAAKLQDFANQEADGNRSEAVRLLIDRHLPALADIEEPSTQPATPVQPA